MSTLRTCPFAESLPDLRRKSYFNSIEWPLLLPRTRFSRYFEVCDDHKAYEHPTNVPVLLNHSQTSYEKVTPILENGRHSCRDHVSQAIVKRATTTRRMSTLGTCPCRGITPGPPTKKLLQFTRMATTVAAIRILKIL